MPLEPPDLGSSNERVRQALDCPDFGKRRADLHRHADADLGEVDAAAFGELPFGNELIDCEVMIATSIGSPPTNNALLEAARGVVGDKDLVPGQLFEIISSTTDFMAPAVSTRTSAARASPSP